MSKKTVEMARPFRRPTIERVARGFGVSAEAIRSAPPPRNDGTVIGLGRDCAHAADLYAAATGRSSAWVAGRGPLLDGPRPDVLVAGIDDLDAGVLAWLYEPGPDASVTGIILRDAPGVFADQLLARAVAVSLDPSPERRVHLDFTRKDTVPLGPDGRPSAVLGGRSRILSVLTHSDGIDAYLGDQLTLCPIIKARPGGRRLPDLPSCVENDYCHRHALPLPRALASEYTLDPDQIRARILIWAVCWGILPVGAPVAPRWSAGLRFVANPAVGALVTTWESQMLSRQPVEMLEERLDSGTPVGRALAELHRSRYARALNIRFALFGDPMATAASATKGGTGEVRTEPVRAAQVDLPPAHGATYQVRFVERLAQRVLTDPGLRPEASPGASSRRRIGTGGLQGLLDTVRDDPSTERAETREKIRLVLLDALDLPCSFSRIWLPLTRGHAADRGLTCRFCRDPRHALRSFVAYLEPGTPGRRLSKCPACGVVEDVPADTPLNGITLGPEMTLELDGSLPLTRWAGAVFARPPSGVKTHIADWPSDPHGRPDRSWKLPRRQAPTGMVDLITGFVFNFELHLFMARCRLG